MNTATKWILEKTLKTVLLGEFDGLKISCFKSKNMEFFSFIEKTLSFLKEVDIRRYNRVIRELKWITNRNGLRLNSGRYNKSLKMCSMNYDISKEVSNEDIVYFSSLIVHESTHAMLHSKGIEYSDITRERIEKLCVTEEDRFLKKAGTIFPEIAKNYLNDFNPEDWDYSWNTSKWIKMLHEAKRIING